MTYRWNKISTLVAPMGNIKFEVINDHAKDVVFPFWLRLFINGKSVLEEDFKTQEDAEAYAECIIKNFQSFNDLQVRNKCK